MFAVFLALPVVVLIARAILSGALAAVAGSPAIIAALGLSLATTSVSLAFAIALGLPLAFVLARRSFRGKWLVEAIVDLPIVLPPAVAGLALLLVFGRRGVLADRCRPLGMDIAVHDDRGHPRPDVRRGAVLRPVGAGRDRRRRSRPRGCGAGRRRDRGAGCSATSPCRSPAPRSPAGLVMTWARALGEFGATIMFAGNVEGRTQTLPLVVYSEFQAGNLDTSIAARRDPRPRRARRARRGAVLPLGKGAGRPERRLIGAERSASQTSAERPPNRPSWALSPPLERRASQMCAGTAVARAIGRRLERMANQATGARRADPIESARRPLRDLNSAGPRHPARARRCVA